MNPLKFILKKCFFFAFLIATECTSKKYHLPLPPNLTGQKKNSKTAVTISSTGADAVVCIGSNNTVHIGKTDQDDQTQTAINDLAHNSPDGPNTITAEGTPIHISSTDPKDLVLVGSNDIYRDTTPQPAAPTTQQQLEQPMNENDATLQPNQPKKERNDLAHSSPEGPNTITAKGTPIQTTSTDPKDLVGDDKTKQTPIGKRIIYNDALKELNNLTKEFGSRKIFSVNATKQKRKKNKEDLKLFNQAKIYIYKISNSTTPETDIENDSEEIKGLIKKMRRRLGFAFDSPLGLGKRRKVLEETLLDRKLVKR